MKKILITSAIFLGILLFTLYLSTTFKKETVPGVEEKPLPVFPVSTNGPEPVASGKIEVTGSAGKKVQVNDFIGEKKVVVDVVNPGNYVLAGELPYCLGDGSCPSQSLSQDYRIEYSEKYQRFNILLLRTPLGSARKAAEVFLQKQLGITVGEMCTLNYTLGAPSWVDETHAGQELGFSFCAGSVSLE